MNKDLGNSAEISVIIPVYNEEGNLPELYKRLINVLENDLHVTYDIIFVDDGSKDNSWNIIEDLHKQNTKVKGIKFSRNFGHQIAITAGIDKAEGDVAVIIDADLQDPPELIPKMVEKWKNGYRVVYAKRKQRKGESKFKLWTASIFYRILDRLTDIKIPLDTGDFRLIDKKILRELRGLKEKNRFVRGIISWVGYKQIAVEYDRDARFSGETKYPLRKMVKFALDGITSFSHKPLKIALNLGFLSIFIGFVMVIYVVISKFLFPEITVSGWASILIAIVFFGGVQLFTIGIIGEYIDRIYDESKNRPLYIIDEEINFKK